MSSSRVLLYISCIASACATPWCDNFKDASEFSFKCNTVYDPDDYIACQVVSNWGNKNLKEEHYTTAPTAPIRWMCPPDARPMPRMSVKFEIDETERGPGIIGSRRLLGTYSAEVYLNRESDVHISDIQTRDYPMKDDCAAIYKLDNGNSVVQNCWKFNDMPHLQVAFPQFKVPTTAYTSYELPDSRVPVCDLLPYRGITFTFRPCKTPDVTRADYVWIRPSYKFYPGLTGKPDHAGRCTIATDPPVTKITEYYTSNENNDQHWPRYEIKTISYKPFPNINKDFLTRTNEYGERIGFNFRASVQFPCEYKKTFFGQFTPSEIFTSYDRKFAPVNAETSKTREICSDYVSEACFKNVYAFYGMPCSWADKSKFTFSDLRDGGFMADTSAENRKTLWGHFRSYGNDFFDFDLSAFKLQVRRYHTNGISRLSPFKVQIADSDVIDIVPEDGYSCKGCVELSGSLHQGIKNDADVNVNDAVQFAKNEEIPLQCRVCLPSEAVTPGKFPIEKVYRRCVECPVHKIRDLRPGKENECDWCNETHPMRVKAALECTACQHVQYFDAKTQDGCKWYVSVSDFIVTFDFIGTPIFEVNNNPRDEYSNTGVAPLIVVKPKYYRTLNIANRWKASSNESACAYYAEEVINATARNLTNATRNARAQRLYYRQWCGHHEIVRHQNALLRRQQVAPVRTNSTVITLREAKGNCAGVGSVIVLKENAKEVMPDNRVAEFKCENQTHKVYFEIRREGQVVQCTVCPGSSYTRQCWPTYHPSMSTVDDEYFANTNSPSPGTCSICMERCRETNHFLNVSLFSCWSNGTTRMTGVDHGRLDYLQERAALHMNYWYKDAVCSTCPSLQGLTAAQPALVTRCGNKAKFEIWHPDDVMTLNDVSQPKIRECCSLKDYVNIVNSVATFIENLDAWCITKEGNAVLECESTIPDLITETQPYCPPGWFVNENCAWESDVWTPKCCSKCDVCSLGNVKTVEYRECPGDTFYDTQAFGCKVECLSGNYRDGDKCYPCETCVA